MKWFIRCSSHDLIIFSDVITLLGDSLICFIVILLIIGHQCVYNEIVCMICRTIKACTLSSTFETVQQESCDSITHQAYMYIHIYVCMCMYGYMYTYVCMYICMHLCARIYVWIRVYVYMYSCVCKDTCMHTCVHIYVCMCMYEYICRGCGIGLADPASAGPKFQTTIQNHYLCLWNVYA